MTLLYSNHINKFYGNCDFLTTCANNGIANNQQQEELYCKLQTI